MSDFKEIIDALGESVDLNPLTCAETERLAEAYEGRLPADYLSFLREVGAGNLGILIIYASPIESFEIYTDRRNLCSIVLFGDDMQGFSYGFDSNDNYRVVEIDPRGNVDRSVEPSFRKFLKSFFAE